MTLLANTQVKGLFRTALILFFVTFVLACDPVDPMPATDSGPSANAGSDQDNVIEGTQSVILDGSGSSPASASFSWEQINIATGESTVPIRDHESASASFTAPFVPGVPGDEPLTLEFQLTVTSGGKSFMDTVRITVKPSPNVDADGDGLIDIDTLAMLHNMRYDLAGASYKADADATGLTSGCPSDSCTGYELTGNLNFDVNGDGRTWTGDSAAGFTLNMADNNASYFNVAMGGWEPIGDATTSFTATFEGNGHTISNLAIKRNATDIGFFGRIAGSAIIRNIGLTDNLADYSGSSGDINHIGGLVGSQAGGSITFSYTTGPVDGGGGGSDIVGGLVGNQIAGSITASYATGLVDGGSGGNDIAGGLLGQQENGSITTSYATGAVDGGTGGFNRVGGLVGRQAGGSITASYATGSADGGAGNSDGAGGLVGLQAGGSITASYATGAADGGGGNSDGAGGLVGLKTGGSVTASYATGAAGTGNFVGGLLGIQTVGSSTVSYGFGMTTGGTNMLGTPPSGLSSATGLTLMNAGAQWNVVASNTLGAWDFGTTDQAPALQYADYDGPDGTVYSCAMFPDFDNPGENLCGTIIPGQ